MTFQPKQELLPTKIESLNNKFREKGMDSN